MSFFDRAKQALMQGRTELTNQVTRFKNKKFMEGTVSVCAYIAMASNGADSSEKQKMMAFVKASDELKVFDSSEVIEFFNKRAASFEFDTDIGKGEAMKYIVALKSDEGAAQLALRVGVAVAKSDGDFNDAEKAAVREICHALGFDPSEYQQ
ncbi:tellurite resistance TerB family protein [Aeromonas encheleia]|uniref:tellurite resistance TerB family protein n=1 Tax=Aeromonas encheleia TaxID=73010 RepID=UPI001F579DE4|nr:tellurite resistance TerB family protein [Aeromonas encheleia]UNP89269.1 tellurite resistance TerB family protein [Aeromonas encheleia]